MVQYKLTFYTLIISSRTTFKCAKIVSRSEKYFLHSYNANYTCFSPFLCNCSQTSTHKAFIVEKWKYHSFNVRCTTTWKVQIRYVLRKEELDIGPWCRSYAECQEKRCWIWRVKRRPYETGHAQVQCPVSRLWRNNPYVAISNVPKMARVLITAMHMATTDYLMATKLLFRLKRKLYFDLRGNMIL
jgi:hypothetical protein